MMVMKNLFAFWGSSMNWTDKRAKLLQELLRNMKVIKFFAWEVPFAKRMRGFRQKEMSYTRSLLVIKAADNTVALAVPALVSVVTFIAYYATGNQLEASVIFASLTLFELLRMPLMVFPISFSSIIDAKNAAQRLSAVFETETLEETFDLEDNLNVAVEVNNVTFTWDAPPPAAEKNHDKKDKMEKPEAMPTSAAEVFKLEGISLSISRGQLVAIGAVGAGKTSLL
ncbi:hypothetical protein DFS33DRAFT_678272 [Desarmillaria ectypa]|nr:hypothetical protein DFS33DRAFT_678272 [Desarmillaria ectypa]